MNRTVVVVGLGLWCGTVQIGCSDLDAGSTSLGGGSDGGGDDAAADDDDDDDDDDESADEGEAGSGTGPGGNDDAGEGFVSPDCEQQVVATSQLPRLTNAQYDRTIRDLVGLTTLTASNGVAPSVLLATDQGGGLSDLGWSSYMSVAQMIAAQVMDDPALTGNYLQCDPSEPTCLHETIGAFGRRAFRRPLTDSEVARFETFLAMGPEITPSGAPEEVAEALLYAFLVSPSFIQRSEISEDLRGDGSFSLTPYEVAARLSYMIWGSMPDAELSLAADRGELSTAGQILAQAERMLQDPKARDMVTAFHRQYLMMGPGGRWDTANKDPNLFPTFSPQQVPYLAEETLRFFDHVAFSGGSFQDFFLSPVAFVNQTTAPLYDLASADFGMDLTQVNLDADERPGFLTRVGFLAGYSSYSNTSPVLRGAFVTKDIIGIHIDSPPPGADQTALPEGDFATNRERFEALTSPTECAGCHRSYINPPGFVLEAFDSVGAPQTVDAQTGAPLNTEATVIVDADEGPVTLSTPRALMEKIATSPTAMGHYASKWVGYAYERPDHPMDECVVDGLTDRMTAGGYTVLNLITDLTQTESFRVRVVEGNQ